MQLEIQSHSEIVCRWKTLILKFSKKCLLQKKVEDDYDAKFLQYADGCMSEGFIAFGVDSGAALQPLFEKIISINKMEI